MPDYELKMPERNLRPSLSIEEVMASPPNGGLTAKARFVSLECGVPPVGFPIRESAGVGFFQCVCVSVSVRS